MSTLPKISSRHQVPREHDGLTGRTEAERREIADRIERVSRLKGRVGGRVLTPFEIALALGADRRAPKKRCLGCSSRLPLTAEYFGTKGADRWDHLCRSCRNRYHARYRATHKENREAKRARERASRARTDRTPRPSTPLSRLKGNRRQARLDLSRATTDAQREHYRARIANLTHEIDRLAEIGGGS